MKVLRPLSFLQSDSATKISLILLNRPTEKALLTQLWSKSVLTVAADGASDHLLTCLGDKKDEFIPDLITGDFDSVQLETLEHYRAKGVEIVPTPDQDETDFTKCLRHVCQRIHPDQTSCIVALGGFGGRIDHSLANINTLYVARSLSSVPLVLLSSSSFACLLDKGEHRLHCDTGLEGDWCGLIPVGQPAEHVTTTGLKWNLNDQEMRFGELISTSNALVDKCVTVTTDQPLLWTMGYKLSL